VVVQAEADDAVIVGVEGPEWVFAQNWAEGVIDMVEETSQPHRNIPQRTNRGK
jgi:hypothetical protein